MKSEKPNKGFKLWLLIFSRYFRIREKNMHLYEKKVNVANG